MATRRARSACCVSGPSSAGVACRLVAQTSLFPGMQHVDVAGGTGDVAFRLAASLQPLEQQAAALHTDLEHSRRPVRAAVRERSAAAPKPVRPVRCARTSAARAGEA